MKQWGLDLQWVVVMWAWREGGFREEAWWTHCTLTTAWIREYERKG